MKNVWSILALLAIVAAGCGGSSEQKEETPAEEVKNEAVNIELGVKEAADTVAAKLYETKEEIEAAAEEVDEALNDL